MTEPLHLNSFGVTLTVSGGFSEAQVDTIVNWCRAISDYLVITREQHASGFPHLHLSIKLKPKSTSHVTLRFKRMYERFDIPYVKGVSVVVKEINDQTGWFAYISKDIPDGQLPLVCVGYLWGDIQKQTMDAVKRLKLKTLKGSRVIMNMNTAVGRIMEFAKRTGTSITGKQSFCDIISKMMGQGYQTYRLKLPVLYAQVLAELGYERIAFDWAESQLQFV